MAPDSISELANSKFFVGEHVLRPPSGASFACSLRPPPTVHLLRRPVLSLAFLCTASKQTVLMYTVGSNRVYRSLAVEVLNH